jgi:TonB-dependent starch-binding outer membrane protein SusC
MSPKKFLQAACTGVLLLVATFSFAQRTVNGKVTDSNNGAGVPGVTVSGKGTRTSTQTTSDGSFSITVPNTVTTLVFTSVGYAGQEVALNGQSTITVVMVLTNATLGEVVVTGYGTVRRKDLTGSIATVGTKDFVKGPLVSPEQLINGKVAGVQITTGGGAPGAGSRIRVRGTSSLSASNNPLIIIDGIPIDQQSSISGAANPLALINPNDIESFNILKDASATAIYGNRATNGVIIITTKKGRTGKFRVNFSTVNSFSVVGDKVDMMSADEFRTLIAGKGNPSQNGLLGTADTDWQDLIYRNAFGSDNNISFTGGVDKLPYRLSLGYLNQAGALKTGHLNRFSTALNLNPKLLNNMLKVDINFKASFTDTRFANEGAIGGAAFFDPTQTVNRNDNRFLGYWEWVNPQVNQPDGLAPKNPIGMLNLREDKSNVRRILSNIQLDYTLPFFRDMRANLNVGIDDSHGEGTIFIPDSAAIAYTRGGVNNMYEQDKSNKLFEFFLNYGKDLKRMRSRVEALAGYAYQDFIRESPNFADFRANGTEFAPAAPNPFYTQNTMISFFGRLDYSLLGRYLLRANIRRDGSSRFSKDNRWGTFPSVAFAWRITDEPFVKPGKVVSDLKFRIGYGETGQQEIGGDYPYLPIYTLGTQTAQYQFGSEYFQVYRPNGYDANIKWETSTTFNVGMDFGFASGKITGSLDYYNKKTEDLLNFIPVPVGTNFTNAILTNVGDMDNQGIEFSLASTVLRKRDLTWDLGFNVTYNRNKITRLTKVDDPNYQGVLTGGISGGVGNTIQIHTVGYRPSSFYVLQQVYDNAGKPIEGAYVDRNDDGIINNLDYYRYKSPEPEWMMGFSTTVNYQKWTFSTVLRSQLGNYMYNNVFASNGVFRTSSLNFLGNVHRNFLETGFQNNQYFSDYYVENASFLKMDNLTVIYDLGNVLRKQANLRLTGSVQNVFTVTKYRGLDPEIAGGVDNNFYPRPRIFSLGINLDF